MLNKEKWIPYWYINRTVSNWIKNQGAFFLLCSAIRGLARKSARQLLRRWWRLRGYDRPWERQMERRSLQLQPAVRLQERNRYGKQKANKQKKSEKRCSEEQEFTERAWEESFMRLQTFRKTQRGITLLPLLASAWPSLKKEVSKRSALFSSLSS